MPNGAESIDCTTTVNDGSLTTTFDESSKTFTFRANTDAFSNYPPGTYTFKITGTVGTDPAKQVTADYQFDLVLTDLCS